jgi:hypothetical protein
VIQRKIAEQGNNAVLRVVQRNVPRVAAVIHDWMSLLCPAEDDWRAIQIRSRIGYALGAVGILIISVVAGLLVCTRGVGPTRSDMHARTLLEPRRPAPFVPPHPLDPAVIAEIDMAKVHGQLLPAWIMSLQHGPRTAAYSDQERAFRALRKEAGRDPNLGILLDLLKEWLRDGAYEFGGHIRALVKGWNDYMARAGTPFRIEYHIQKTAHGPELYVRAYRAVADVVVTVDTAPYRVRLLTREDHTNLVEGFLGQTSVEREAALVVADRVVDFTIERLWPLFDVEGELVPSDTDPGLSAKLRADAMAAIGATAFERVASSSALHHEIETEIAKLKQRQGCGSIVRVPSVPWDGLSDRTLSLIDSVAKKNEARHCERMTVSDAERIVTLSRRLHDDPDLAQALGKLASWVVRAVVVHEARHLADDLDPDLACKGCPDSMSHAVRAEVSAYLASFAAEGIGHVALLQACGVTPGMKEAHSAALSFLLPKLLPSGCYGPMPEGFPESARALERELFGREDAVKFPVGFPEAVPLRRE